MGGLLYKDFVSINRIHKMKLTWILIFFVIFYIFLRFLFPGKAEYLGIPNLTDIIFLMILGIFIITSMGLINGFIGKIVESDDKNKIRGYLSSMPFSTNTYIASKYVFIGIACYVFLSLEYILTITCEGFCNFGQTLEMCNMLKLFIIPLMSITLFLAAIELPLFILAGKEKATLIKVAILLFLAFLIIGYVMFGNLNLISEHLNIYKLIEWKIKHETEIIIFSALAPVITLVLYYLSYLTTCTLYKRMEK